MSPTELYRHWDVADRLLYVGISRCARTRLGQHISRSAWGKSIVKITVETHPTLGAAVDAEARAILTERPMFNKAGTKPRPSIEYDDAEEMAKVERFLARGAAA